MKVKVYHNGDDTFIAWKPDGLIPECRGFALRRRRNGIEEVVSHYQYRWRYRRQIQPKKNQWKGLEDGDSWQKGYLKAGSAALREINFWVGDQMIP